MRPEPLDENFPPIESVARSPAIDRVAVNRVVATNHEVSLILAGLKQTRGGEDVPAGCVQSGLEFLLAALYRVEEHAGVGADEELSDFPHLLEAESFHRSRSENRVLHVLRLVSGNVSFVDRDVAPFEAYRHALSVLGNSQSRRLLEVRLDSPKTGRDGFTELVQVPHFELEKRLRGVVDLMERGASQNTARLAE